MNCFHIFFQVNRSLTELHLQKLEMTPFAVEILVDGLKDNKTLLLLDLSCNGIEDNGVEHLCEFLKIKPPLQALILNHGRIRSNGAK